MKIRVLKNQGPLQTLENFQVLQTGIYNKKPEKNLGDKRKKNSGVQDLKFF